MSGIVGIYSLSGRPVEQDDVRRMVDRLAHRGPDGADCWVDGTVGLGHRMLWTTPESLLEKLPLIHPQTGWVITADARIDNREDLMAMLHIAYDPVKKITDSDLILAAYEKWGDRCPEYLLGDFAFIIWDAQNQKLFCARDPMGVKPLYYYHTDDLFVVASEVKAILCLPDVPQKLNEVRVAAHLLGFEDSVSTFYQNILRLPAAHTLVIRSSGQQLRSYWSVDYSDYIRLPSSATYAEAFRNVFVNAVSCRMRSAFPVGTMLSGGLDSSSVACVARNLNATGHPLPTFSYIFPTVSEIDKRIDERNYINAVLETGGFSPHYIHADCLSPLLDFNQVVWHIDGAFPAANLFMDWELFKQVKHQNVRVLFTGHDGDSTVSHGHEALSALARQGRWIKLIREAKGLSKTFYNSTISAKKLIQIYGLQPLIPGTIQQLWQSLKQSPSELISPEAELINSAFANRLRISDYMRSLNPPPAKNSKEEHWRNVTCGLMQYVLQTLDELAAAHSIELRHPFCDRRLVEFCLAIPPEQKLNQGWNRAVMRKAMQDILPPAVQWRMGKAHLGSNFSLKLLEYEKETLNRVILQDLERVEAYVNVDKVQAAYQRYQAQPMKHRHDAFVVFLAVNLTLWLQQVDL
jgi:asparagine synthase (glutamine-hydrolysing)